MIGIDTNLLIYAHKAESPHHDAAVAALRPIFEGSQRWAIPWPSLYEFLSVATNPKIFRPASSVSEAWAFLDPLLNSPHLRLLAETSDYLTTFAGVAHESKVIGARILRTHSGPLHTPWNF